MKLTIREGERPDGNGVMVKGFYIFNHGIAVGMAYRSAEEALVAMRLYIADLNKMLPA